jgi:hypothetical protein
LHTKQLRTSCLVLAHIWVCAKLLKGSSTSAGNSSSHKRKNSFFKLLIYYLFRLILCSTIQKTKSIHPQAHEWTTADIQWIGLKGPGLRTMVLISEYNEPRLILLLYSNRINMVLLVQCGLTEIIQSLFQQPYDRIKSISDLNRQIADSA